MNSIFNYFEKYAAMAQGKGYGAGTVERDFKLATKLMRTAPSFMIDVGGNKGLYTREMKKKFPACEVHIFEPARSNAEALSATFAGDKGIRLAPFALGEKTAERKLFADTAGSGLGSLTKRLLDHANINFVHEGVSVVRFEDYWNEKLAGRRIDFAEIDVDGHELYVLKGLRRALEATQTIQFEFGGCNIDTRTYFRDFVYFFSERGFSISRIGLYSLQRIRGYRECEEYVSTTNFLASRNLDA